MGVRNISGLFWCASIAVSVLLSVPTGARAQSTVAKSNNNFPLGIPNTGIQVNTDTFGRNIVGDAANEPSIAIDPTDPRKIVIGWRQFDSIASDFRQAGSAYSHDGGRSWISKTLSPGSMGTDPVLATSSDGRLYYLSINFEVLRLFRSMDFGLTWQVPFVANGFEDKPWMSVDQGSVPGKGNVYIAANSGHFWRSTDYGQSFTESYPVASSIVLSLSVDSDGSLYWADRSGRIWRSGNAWDSSNDPEFKYLGFAMPGYSSGQFGAPPNPGGLFGQGWVIANPYDGVGSGEVYYLASVLVPIDSVDVRFARSTNGGVTWSDSVRVNDDPPGDEKYHWFGMMSVAPNGRIDAVWNDTRNSGQANLSELYYSYSTDAGETWSVNEPVSPVFDSHVGWPVGPQKLGDYYHMISDTLGVNVAYAATFNGEQDIYFLRIGPWDCNGNEIDDAQDIANHSSRDCNSNEVPDECEYRVDIDGDGLTTIEDFTELAARMSDPTTAPLLTKEEAGGGPWSAEHRDAKADPPQSPLGKGGGTDSRGAPLLLEPGCDQLFDANHDGRIDLVDYAYLQRVLVAE